MFIITGNTMQSKRFLICDSLFIRILSFFMVRFFIHKYVMFEMDFAEH